MAYGSVGSAGGVGPTGVGPIGVGPGGTTGASGSGSTTGTFPEADGASIVDLTDRHYSSFNIPVGLRQLAIFSTVNKFFHINYILRVGTNQTRSGKLTLTVDETNTDVAITDEYQYSAPFQQDHIGRPEQGTLMTDFEFLASIDNTGDTVILSYIHRSVTGDVPGSVAYSLSYSV